MLSQFEENWITLKVKYSKIRVNIIFSKDKLRYFLENQDKMKQTDTHDDF